VTEEEIAQAHKDRVADLVSKYGGDKFAVPMSEYSRLADLNKQDWIQHITERDGRRSKPKPEPVPVPRREDGSIDEAAAALAAFAGHTVEEMDPRIGRL